MGEKLLNVDFYHVKERLVDESFDSIGVVQEICKLCCQFAGINSTSGETVLIKEEYLEQAMTKKLKSMV